MTCFKSVKDFDEACEIIHGTRRVLSHGGFNLTKFVTNDRVLLEPVRCQAITRTNADLLSIRLLGTNFSEIRFGIISFSFKKMHLKLLFAKTAAILSMRVIEQITIPRLELCVAVL